MALYGLDNLLSQIRKTATKSNGGILISGPKGMGKRAAADIIIPELLGRPAEIHPDYILVCPEEGKRSIGTEQIEQLQSKIVFRPAMTDRRIILIDDANSLTVQAQNTLLKVLEDSQDYNLFILISHAEMLPTIHSRLQEIKVCLMNEYETEKYLLSVGVSENDIPFYIMASRGCIGRYIQVSSDESLRKIFYSTFDYLVSKESNKAILYEIFHCMKEKDKDNFYEVYPEEVLLTLFGFLDGVFLDFILFIHGVSGRINFKASYSVPMVLEILDLIQDQIHRLKRNQYTNTDFFNFIRKLSSLK